MPARFRTGLFLFRRDLRLPDNTGLRAALERCERVIPAFIFDPRQQPDENPYFSPPAFQFLLESLADLDEQLAEHGGRLYRFRGLPHRVIARLLAEHGERLALEAVFVNRDHTPFSRSRDDEIEKLCDREGLAFESHSDLLLHEPGSVLTGGGGPYRVFTPFYRRARPLGVPAPRKLPAKAGERLFTGRIPFAEPKSRDRELLPAPNPDLPPFELHVHGGRRRAKELLGRLGRLAAYEEERDLPAVDGTSSLSAHHKFGTVSVRETLAALEAALGEAAEPLVRQLYWRDFFSHLGWHYPHVFTGCFHERYDDLEWDEDEERFAAWCEGETGFPLVDAGMRQLAETGWMHNRVRMVTASFLTKDLHLDWRLGERWFARRLVDYDPAVNNGSWQWAASTGADAQPYFRIFNPWSQQRKFDPEGEYIRRWVPELEGVAAADLHRLAERRPPGLGGYPSPLVDHRREAREAQIRYQRVGG